MKQLLASCFVASLLLASASSASAQFPKIKAPKVETPKIETPKIKVPKGGDDKTTTTTTTKSDSKSDIKIGSKSKGSFSNISDDYNADHHRETCDKNLDLIAAEYAKPTHDYPAIFKLQDETNKAYGFVKNLEPNVDASKFDEKYTPLKSRIDTDRSTYDKAKALEKTFESSYQYDGQYKEYSFYEFKKRGCYCNESYPDGIAKDSEFSAKKTEYQTLTSKLVGYKHERTNSILANNAACYTHANTYATWLGNTNIQKLEKYATDNQANQPKDVIKEADSHLEIINMMTADPSYAHTPDADAALASGKARAEKVKAAAETYISSGQYQAHLDKLHKEKIAKVFLPKAKAKNASLEQGAMNYIKTDEQLGTPLRAVLVDTDYRVAKNDVGIPKWQYKEIVVAYKDKDGKCHMVSTYASYTYKGGGTYATTPTWGHDYPEEMACENVNK